MSVASPRPPIRGLVALCCALAPAGCLQHEQALPFDVDEGVVSTQQIGSQGGLLSLASGFSLSVPPGALSQTVQVTANRLITRPFPPDEGTVVPGTAFDVVPAGLALDTAARIELRVRVDDVAPGDQVRMGIAVETPAGVTFLPGGSYDATSGILSAPVRQLGAVAAVLARDALGVEPGDPPTLVGGTFEQGAGGADMEAAGAALAQELSFASSCAPDGRRCFSSGLLKAWIDEDLRERLGQDIRILGAVVSANMEFSGFDLNGNPTVAVGEFVLTGTLRATVGRSVNSYAIDRRVRTGPGTTPSPTGVTVVGNTLFFTETSDPDDPKEIEFEVRRIGTGQLLTVRMEDEVTLENADGSETTGTVIVHLRLRR